MRSLMALLQDTSTTPNLTPFTLYTRVRPIQRNSLEVPRLHKHSCSCISHDPLSHTTALVCGYKQARNHDAVQRLCTQEHSHTRIAPLHYTAPHAAS
jgi:hypothetical protein